MKQLRVLVVVPYYQPAIGGVETYSQAIANDLKEQGHHVTIVTTRLPGTTAVDEQNSIIRLKSWLKFSNTPINPMWYSQFSKIIRTLRPDVIHAHSPVPFFADMAILAARKRVPILLTYHAGSMKKGDNSLSDKLIGLYEKHVLPRLFRRVDKVGAVLPRFAEQAIRQKDKVVFTPPGIDCAIYTPDAQAARTTDIIFVGRIESTSEWKGLDVLLRAIVLVKAKRPDVVVQIVGTGDAVDRYRQLAKELSIDENVSFLTDRRGPQVVPLYQAAKIIVLPSKTEAESFGMVLAEAMACGVAPIGSRIGGIPNVVTHEKTGLLFPPSDEKALSQSILELLERPDYRGRLAKHATHSIREQFSLQRMTSLNRRLLTSIARKEIVHVSAYYPPHLGGMEAAIAMLAHKLHDDGRRIRVISSRSGGEASPSPFPVQRLRAIEVVSTPIMPSLWWTLMRCSPRSIFHVHVAQAGVPEVAFLAATLKRVPLIMHLHGDVEASSAAGFLLPLYKKIFLGFVLRRADAVIVPTETYKQMMTKRYALKRPVHVIPAGIDERFFIGDKTKNAKEITTILFVGRLTVEKNVDLLIKAAGLVPHPVRLVVVGDGPLRASLEKQARSIRNCTVSFVGRKSPQELIAYYRQADMLVLASNYESQSLVVLEAMATGTPVVVANVPAVNEIVGTAGLLVDKTAEAFSHAMTQLMTQPALYAELVRKGKVRAAEFSWDSMTQKFGEIYDEQ